MKRVKNLVLKGIVAGMTLASGFGVVAPAMMNATPVLAAETEVAGSEDVYENTQELYANFGLKLVYGVDPSNDTGDDKTYYIDCSDGTIKYTFTVTDVEQTSEEGFKNEKEARKYASDRCWHNINVVKDSQTNTYTVSGEIHYGTVRTVKIDHKISYINMQCDNQTLEVGKDTPIFVTVDDDCDVTQLEVGSHDDSVASVVMAQPGVYVVVANNPGSTTIYAKATDGSNKSSCVNICVSPQQENQ